MKVAEFGVSLRGWLRSSDIGCGFEDAGPVRPEDCFPVPSLSVVRGGASASPAGREFEIAYVDAEADARRLALIDAWSVPFEECMPVRGFPSYKGQRNRVGRWWTATTGSVVGYESWLERDWLMLARLRSGRGRHCRPAVLAVVDHAGGQTMLTRTDYFGYQRSSLRSDVIAGLTVWAVLVPESLAYATIAGVSPVVDCCNDVGRRLAVQGARSLSTRDR